MSIPASVPFPLSPSVIVVLDELRHAGLGEGWIKDSLAFSALADQWPPPDLSGAAHDSGKAQLLDLAETLSYRHQLILDAVARLGDTGLHELAVANGIADLPDYRTLLHTATADGGLAAYFLRRTGPVSDALERGDTIVRQNLLAMVDPMVDSSADACTMCLASLPIDLLIPGLGSVMVFIHLGCAAAACAAM